MGIHIKGFLARMKYHSNDQTRHQDKNRGYERQENMKKGPHRRLVILRQAAKIFHERGYTASSLRELAQHCGIQGASIYHHFSSKQDILHEIMDYTMTTLIERLKETIEGVEDPLEKLDRAIRFHIQYHINNPYITHVTDTELRSLKAEYLEHVIRKRDEYEGFFHGMLTEGVAAGLIKVDNIPLTRMAILQMCTAVTIWFCEDGPLAVDQVAEVYARFIRRAVAGRVKGPGET